MLTKSALKGVIVSNEDFILQKVKNIVRRNEIRFPQSLNKTVILYGVRRSGKTFILFDLFRQYKERSLYIDLEDERLAGFEVKDFELLRSSFLELKPGRTNGETVFLLDEVQNIKGWEIFCRRVVEREKAKVFVSGSSSRMMPFEIHTGLRGRVWSVEVLPFSFGEYLTIKNLDLREKKILYGTRSITLKNYFSEYLRWGGFPEVSLTESEFEKRKLLKEYFSAMFFRDMVERYDMTNMALLDALTDKLFTSFSTRLSLNSFYKQYKDKFPFSKDILFRYYKDFLSSMLVFEVRKFSESTYKRMRNPAKIYMVDTGLCRRVEPEDSGRLLENAIYLELRRRNCEVFYFEERGECDFIAKTEESKFMAIQVAFELHEQNREREIGGLVAACEHLGIKEGKVLTYDSDEEEMKVGKITVNIAPAWKWLISPHYRI
jgi:hypothetical protein